MANKRVLLFTWKVLAGQSENLFRPVDGYDLGSLNNYMEEQEGALTAVQIIDWLVANEYYKDMPTPIELGMSLARSPMFRKYKKHGWDPTKKGYLWLPLEEDEIIDHINSGRGFTKNIPAHFKRKAKSALLKEHS